MRPEVFEWGQHKKFFLKITYNPGGEVPGRWYEFGLKQEKSIKMSMLSIKMAMIEESLYKLRCKSLETPYKIFLLNTCIFPYYCYKNEIA